jgi:hypothetical protein
MCAFLPESKEELQSIPGPSTLLGDARKGITSVEGGDSLLLGFRMGKFVHFFCSLG